MDLRDPSDPPPLSKGRNLHEKNDDQRRAYLQWSKVRVTDWFEKIGKEKEAPNAKQMSFLLRVAERCKQEAFDFQQTVSKEFPQEPIRDCLLGLPGAGKSTCIKLLRRFFEECLGWEHGIQFQFLATQNTMAALIGGGTVHSWGTIPVNATDAASKVQSKNADGDIDDLFLNALAMRFLVIDESSTASLSLLGLLDAYLRRACSRHPHARIQQRRRPFGGINIIFAGDFWQLPPVRANAIFSNPYRKDQYGMEEMSIYLGVLEIVCVCNISSYLLVFRNIYVISVLDILTCSEMPLNIVKCRCTVPCATKSHRCRSVLSNVVRFCWLLFNPGNVVKFCRMAVDTVRCH